MTDNDRTSKFIWEEGDLEVVSEPTAPTTASGLTLPGHLSGIPKSGDGTARRGYGVAIFQRDGYRCAYCALDMARPYEAWLQLSIDHIVPRQSVKAGFPVGWIEDGANLITCCRACNEFGNRYRVATGIPASDEDFLVLRDRIFRERSALIRARHARERERYRLAMSNTG